MEAFLSKEVRAGIKQAREKAERKRSRLCVHVGDDVYSVNRYWDTGFTVDLETVPKLRGLVDLYDGPRHLAQCLIVRAEKSDDVMFYEFKRKTDAVDYAALDYERASEAPIALLS